MITKDEFLEKVVNVIICNSDSCGDMDLSRKAIKTMIDSNLEAITFTILKLLSKKDDSITIRGFGTFKSVTLKERKGYNPKTKEKMIIPERRVIRFKASKKLS